MNARDLPELAPLAAALVLLELAAGTVAITLLTDVLGRVGRGFLGTTTLIAAAILGIDLLIMAGLPAVSPPLPGAVASAGLHSLSRWTLALTLAALAYVLFCAVGTGGARLVLGALMLLTAAGALVTAALVVGPAFGGAGRAALIFVPAALLSGSALTGMLLGHWYLIAPDLSFRPLREAIYVIFAAVAVEAATIGVAMLAVRGEASASLVREYAVPFWVLVVGSGVLFTAAVNGLTLYFARMRANQPATAMLYVLIISVAMGVVPGHLLYFLTGVPV